MQFNRDTLLDCALKFFLGVYRIGDGDVPVFMERNRVHGWTVWARMGEMAPFYLAADGLWAYKAGDAWKTYDEALDAFTASKGKLRP